LERRFETFTKCSRNELIRHGIISVREALAEEKLNDYSCDIVVVGIGEAFFVSGSVSTHIFLIQ
jgi:hypothetical protein